jgi:hypothetical protein
MNYYKDQEKEHFWGGITKKLLIKILSLFLSLTHNWIQRNKPQDNHLLNHHTWTDLYKAMSSDKAFQENKLYKIKQETHFHQIKHTWDRICKLMRADKEVMTVLDLLKSTSKTIKNSSHSHKLFCSNWESRVRLIQEQINFYICSQDNKIDNTTKLSHLFNKCLLKKFLQIKSIL